MTTTIWKVSGAKTETLFTSRDLILRSIRLSHSALPNVKIRDHGNSVMVEFDDPEGGVVQQWFSIEQIVNAHVYNNVEHL